MTASMISGVVPVVSAQLFPNLDTKFLYTNRCGECHGRKGGGGDQGGRNCSEGK